MSQVTRKKQIRRNRVRKAKIRRLKARLLKTGDAKQVETAIRKIQKISPFYPLGQVKSS